jgi:hypothetical protein
MPLRSLKYGWHIRAEMPRIHDIEIWVCAFITHHILLLGERLFLEVYDLVIQFDYEDLRLSTLPEKSSYRGLEQI